MSTKFYSNMRAKQATSALLCVLVLLNTTPTAFSLSFGEIVAGAVCGAGAVVFAPVVLGAAGFTAAGVTAGSYAAGMMSGAAIANGGGVVAGSTVAVLQSVGAAGLGVAGKAALASVGAAVGTVVTHAVKDD